MGSRDGARAACGLGRHYAGMTYRREVFFFGACLGYVLVPRNVH